MIQDLSPLDLDPSPRAPVPPSGSSSSSEGAVDVRRKCLRCHRRMSRKSFDSHTFCSNCRSFDCDLDSLPVVKNVLTGLRVIWLLILDIGNF